MHLITAQNEMARTKINGITDSGFYKILLAPEDKIYARRDLGNLRIVNEAEKEIPYITESGTNSKQVVAITDFKTQIFHDTALRKSIIHVVFDYPVQLHQMSIHMTAPTLYKRPARLYYTETGSSDERSQDLLFFSETRNVHVLDDIYTKALRIEIENADDMPLQIASFGFFQKPTYIISLLKPGDTYSLLFFELDKPTPEYDLKYFRNKISANLPLANLEGVIKKESPKKSKSEINTRPEKTETNWFMWACIGFGGILTLVISSRLLRDLKKNQT